MAVDADTTLFLQLTRVEALMVSAGLVQLGMDSGLMWELDVDVDQVTSLANKMKDAARVQEFL